MKIRSLMAGLAGVMLLILATNAQSQSFNCRYAKKPDEVKVCQSSNLRQLDEELADVYSEALLALSREDRALLEREQNVWLAKRGRCRSSEPCLDEAYRSRIEDLKSESKKGLPSAPAATNEEWRDKSLALIKKEEVVQDAIWSARSSLWVGVYDNGSKRDGLAETMCVLTGLAGRPDNASFIVSIMDYRAMIQGKIEKLGTYSCP